MTTREVSAVSYTLGQKEDHRFRNLLAGDNPPHYIRVKVVSPYAAVIACYNSPGCEWKIYLDDRYSLVCVNETDTRIQEMPFEGIYVIIPQNSYELYFQGKLLLSLCNERRQALTFDEVGMHPVHGYPPF